LSLINEVWQHETVPHNWGTGVVVNLYKAGSSTDPGNYRGITLISMVRKLFSTMVRLRLEKKVELHESQCAFRRNRSCIDHIYTLAQLVHESGATNRSMYAFFLDMKKAYDTVWREGLFYKLKQKGVKGKMWRVLLDLFSKSNSSVRVAGEMSDGFPLQVGVGQGDPLSTLLFDIYIDDLLESLHSEEAPEGICISDAAEIRALTFADDVACLNHDAQGLQACINHVGEWLKKWRMHANTQKSVVMVFHPKEDQSAAVPVEQRMNFWTMDGHTLSQVESFKYLGVWFSENGSWDLHASKALAKMRSALGYWKPLLACHRLPIKIRVMMIQTFIYSSVLYGSEVWDTSEVNRRCFDVVAKDAIRAVMGLQCHEVASDILFTDTGLLPPSSLMDAAKLCYNKRLVRLQPTRWCKQARVCHFYGHRRLGRPRVGVNWLADVQKLSGDICHTLNISDVFKACEAQQAARRVSQRSQAQLNVAMQPAADDVAVNESSDTAARNQLLNNLWLRQLRRGQAKYQGTSRVACPWLYTCLQGQSRSLAGYLSSLPSLKARLVMSARSGKLFALKDRMLQQTFGFVPPPQHCQHCEEHLPTPGAACVHCAVDCPGLWPEIDRFFETVRSLGSSGVNLAGRLESVLGVDLLTLILTVDKEMVPKELMVSYWSAVAELLSCRWDGGEDTSGQAGQGEIGMFALGDVVDSLNTQVALGDANVHVDAVVL
jgi:hypothetical protein